MALPNEVNVGTAPNNGTGDPLRTGGQKINANFVYLDNNKIGLVEKGANNGVATLDSTGKLTASQLPALAITDVIVATENTIAAFAANSGNYTFQQGDVIIINDGSGNITHYLYVGGIKTDVNEYNEINGTEIEISQVNGLQAALDAKANDSEVIKGIRDSEGNLLTPNAQREVTLPEIGSGIYANVKDFGAEGDGVTDDSSAIENAITELNSAGGGTIFYPKGIYIAENLSVHSNITHLGEGWGASTLKLKTGAINPLFKYKANSGLYGAYWKGLQLEGIGVTGQNGIDISLATLIQECGITDCYIFNFNKGVNGSQNDRMFHIVGNRLWNNDIGYYINNNHPNFGINDIRNNRIGVGGDVIYDCQFIGTKFNYNEYGVKSDTGKIDQSLFVGCYFFGNTNTALHLTNRNKVTNCVFAATGGGVDFINISGRHNGIVNNEFKNETANSLTGYAVRFTGLLIICNYINDNNFSDIGKLINQSPSAGTLSEFSFQNNNMISCNKILLSEATAHNLNISGNSIYLSSEGADKLIEIESSTKNSGIYSSNTVKVNNTIFSGYLLSGDLRSAIIKNNNLYDIELVDPTSNIIDAVSYDNNVNGESYPFLPIDNNTIAIDNPLGGNYSLSSSQITGAIKIKLPVLWTNTVLSFNCQIHNGVNNESITVNISGYNRAVTSKWEATTAQVISSSSKDYAVRFGHDGTYACIWIGEVTTLWDRVHVSVNDLKAGFQAVDNRWYSNWEVSIVTTFGTITETKENNFPYADANKTKNLTDTPRLYTAQQGFQEFALTDAANVAWDANTAQVARLQATALASRTIALSNTNPGVNYQLTYIQDATGGRVLDLSNFDSVYGAIDLGVNKSSIINVVVTNTGTSFAVITSDVSVGINNITEIPNRSYNDLQDLPYSQNKIIQQVDFPYTFQLGDEEVNIILEGSGDLIVPDNVFSSGDKINILGNDTGISNVTPGAFSTVIANSKGSLGVDHSIYGFGSSSTITFYNAGACFLSGDVIGEFMLMKNDTGVIKKVQIIGNTLDISDF